MATGRKQLDIIDNTMTCHTSRFGLAAACILLLASAPASGQQNSGSKPSTDQTSALASRIQVVMDRPEFKHAMFGVALYSLADGRMVWSHNAEKLFVSASTTKLLTEGTALQLLGDDYRFHTRVYRTGRLNGSTIDGDLVLVASGDPNLSGRIQPGDQLAFENVDHAYDASPDTRAVPGDPLAVIRELASQVAAKGIKRVTGRVLVDYSLFREGDRELGTGVVISPIVVNDNLVDLTIGAGPQAGAPTTVQISPVTPYVKFVNKSTTGAAGSRPSITWSSDVTDPDGTHTVTISGTFPADKSPILFSYAVPEPSRFAEVVFADALRAQGIAVNLASAAAQKEYKGTPAAYTAGNTLAEHISPPFREDVKVTLKVSQNLHASTTPFIVKSILARNDTSKTGFDLEHDFLVKAGLDLGGAQQTDGAGGDARFSPSFMVHYLEFMSKQGSFDAFFKALPVLGRDGTLWNIERSSPAAGHIFAKTGTLGGYDALNRRMLISAKGLAGYLITPSGKRYAVAFYVNNVSVSLDPEEVTRVAGQALGEIATIAYQGLP
jgi:D-alanyl-D-alanine carboxypeptidase/D-alanyl-D-alanine-endopeptidase (penicillin-binding protein 4)